MCTYDEEMRISMFSFCETIKTNEIATAVYLAKTKKDWLIKRAHAKFYDPYSDKSSEKINQTLKMWFRVG